jgi:membrane-bound serine protease (ClpP class)
MKILGAILAFLVCVTPLAAQTLPAATEPSGAKVPAAVVSISGEIEDFSRDSFIRRFNQAKADGAKVIIVRINTYGGLATAGWDMSRFIKSQSDVHTIAYVSDKAISAGAMIAMACDEIVMSENATLGDCAPIEFKTDGTVTPLQPTERAKTNSPILADFQDSAVRNHHNPLLAAAMVDLNVVVYWMQSPDGERKFVGQEEHDQLLGAGWKPVDGAPNPIDSANTLLTVGTAEAVQIGLASGKASTAENLAEQRGLSISQTLESGFGESVFALLNAGWVRMILITIFGTAVYAALHAPGHGAAEAIAITTLGLLLGIPLLAGYATWWELGLILGGLALVAFEIFVFPHAGIMIVGGILMMLVGLVFTFVGGEPGGSPLSPHLPETWNGLRNGVLYVGGGLVLTMLLCWWLSRYLPDLPYFGRLVLTTTTGAGGAVAATTVAKEIHWPTIGAVGRAVTPLKPGGSAEFSDPRSDQTQVLSVVSETGYLPIGAPVVVREVGGGRLIVRSTI